MRLVHFMGANGHTEFFVNPELVRYVGINADGDSYISFDDEDSIAVSGSIEAVSTKLERGSQ